MKNKSAENGKHGGKRVNSGRKVASPDGLPAVRVSVSLPAALSARLDSAAEQIGRKSGGRSAIVAAGLRSILSQSPDRLRDAVAGRG